jgi:hypothetical protein
VLVENGKLKEEAIEAFKMQKMYNLDSLKTVVKETEDTLFSGDVSASSILRLNKTCGRTRSEN